MRGARRPARRVSGDAEGTPHTISQDVRLIEAVSTAGELGMERPVGGQLVAAAPGVAVPRMASFSPA